MSKHTPGPWRVSPYGVGFEVADENDNTILQAQQTRPTLAASDHDERRANARLAAAAPELLEALQLIEQWDSCGFALTEGHMARARTAIAKAKGGTQ